LQLTRALGRITVLQTIAAPARKRLFGTDEHADDEAPELVVAAGISERQAYPR
jgi:hypothetical protein